MARAVGVNAPPAPLEGWFPVRIQERDVPVVEWCWLGGLGFDEPFFVQTVERAFRTKSSDGLEPSTPSLPWNVSGDRSQPATNGFRLFEPLLRPSHLPAVPAGCARWAPCVLHPRFFCPDYGSL